MPWLPLELAASKAFCCWPQASAGVMAAGCNDSLEHGPERNAVLLPLQRAVIDELLNSKRSVFPYTEATAWRSYIFEVV